MPRSSRWTKGGNYGMDHSTVLYLMGPDGKLVSFYDEAIIGPTISAEGACASVRTI